MTRYAFAIDLDRCIGCHACTVACKAEHEIPLGVWRDWVKEVDRGVFPDTERIFLPVLCNQCEDAPCMTICPTRALFRRPDGIVDLDPAACIGCRACMAACPYHQLFIDPNTRTAEKCNFCANRLEVDLAPACVIVCPTECRVFGDLDDPEDPLNEMLRTREASVRRPECRTGPKNYYFGARPGDLDPLVPARAPIHRCADPGPQEPAPVLEAGAPPPRSRPDPAIAWARARPEARSFLAALAAHPSGEVAPGAAKVSLDVFHRRPWGLDVAAYLVTKGIAAGSLGVACALSLSGSAGSPLLSPTAPAIALAFLLATAALLVFDLERPQRFHFLLWRPNLRSWLVWGGFALAGFGAVAAMTFASAFFGDRRPSAPLAITGIAASAAAQGYSAFLFQQAARARELWGGRLRLAGLLVEGALLGSASLLLATAVGAAGGETAPALRTILGVALVLHAALVFADLLVESKAGTRRALAARAVLGGEWRASFWFAALGGGILLPLGLLGFGAGAPLALAAAALLAIGGVFAWSRAWIYAGQALPLA